MTETIAWAQINDQHLAATVAWIRLRLERMRATPQIEQTHTNEQPRGWFGRHKADEKKLLSAPKPLPQDETIARARAEIDKLEEHSPPPALILLAKHLALSKFDSYVLALCAAMELDTRIAGLCAAAQDDTAKRYPTFALAFAVFDEPDWNSLSPHGPLRYWRLINIHQPGLQPLTNAALNVDERIVNYLKGLNYLDDRIASYIDPLPPPEEADTLPHSQKLCVDQVVNYWRQANASSTGPVIELTGRDSPSKRLIATHVCAEIGAHLYLGNLKMLPDQIAGIETFTRLWQREGLLMPLALMLEYDETNDAEKTQLKRVLKQSGGTLFLDCVNGDAHATQTRLSLEVDRPTPEEQQQVWKQALPDPMQSLGTRLAEQFSFDQTEIHRLAGTLTDSDATDVQAESVSLWETCRVTARASMAQLAQRIDAKARIDQLVLPDEQKDTLRLLTDQVAQRNRVYEEWGFREKMNRGLGINALFAGESGTGKTMAAEVIANMLNLDLYRIDLSMVVNKYIGETEKNLRKLFDAAEDSGAILFFDEADALFGKRSEVKDSHDRYANIEINYLLQRMESYKGLAILATNMKSALDKAFVRRLRFIINFPFPDGEQRAEIWRKVFPPETPVADTLDYQRLAKLHLTGGNIHNVALNAAFLSAHDNTPVDMPMLLHAARLEFKKLERPMKESDFRWQDAAGEVA